MLRVCAQYVGLLAEVLFSLECQVEGVCEGKELLLERSILINTSFLLFLPKYLQFLQKFTSV